MFGLVLNLLFYIAIAIVGLLVFLVLFGRLLLPINPFKKDMHMIYVPPTDDITLGKNSLFWKIVGRLTGHAAATFQAVGENVASDLDRGGGTTHLKWGLDSSGKGYKFFVWNTSFFKTAVSCNTEADARYVLLNSSIYQKPGDVYGNLDRVLGSKSLVNLRDVAQHQRIRRAINPAFQKSLIHGVFGETVFPQHASGMCAFLEETKGEPTTEFVQQFEKMALTVISQAGFRLDKKGLEDTDLFKEQRTQAGFLAESYLLIVAFPLNVQRFLRTLSSHIEKFYSAVERNCATLRSLTKKIIETAAERDPAEHDKSLVDVISRSSELSMDEKVDQLQVLTFASVDTSSTTLSFFCHYLAEEPEVQNMLFEELCDACALDAVPTFKDIENLSFLHDCFRECLRLACPISGLPRVCAKQGGDVLPSGLHVPFGAEVGVNILLLCRNPDFWGSDSHVFRPSRWQEEKIKKRLQTEPCNFIPFSFGSRSCIGETFGTAEIKVTIASIVRRFKIEGTTHPHKRPKIMLALTLRPSNRPEDACPLKFIKRES